MLKIYLTRHGQDEDNAKGILNDRRDNPLTRLGQKQAGDLSGKIKTKNIKFSAVYTSPLQRSISTAKIISRNLGLSDPVILGDLTERDFGEMTGKKVSDIDKLLGKCNLFLSPVSGTYYMLKAKDLESFQQAIGRAEKILSFIYKEHNDGNILMVTHGDIGLMIFATYYDINWLEVLKNYHFGNTNLIELSHDLNPGNSFIISVRQYNK